MTEPQPPDTPPPPTTGDPPEPDPPTEGLLELQYKADIDRVQLPWRDAVAAAAAALKVIDDREDKTTETLRARADSASDAEDALVKAIHDAYLEVVSGSLDRAVKRGEFVVTVVTAITTIYTGLLGVVYATAAAGTTRYLPGRALLPVVFLGISLVLSAYYMSFLRSKTITVALLPSGIGGTLSEQRLRTFFDWTFAGVLERAWALRLSVISLGIAVTLLPIAFVSISGASLLLLTIALLVGVAVAMAVINLKTPFTN